MARLTTRTIRDSSELVAYFNELAVAYAEARGDADRLPKRNLPDVCAKASVRI